MDWTTAFVNVFAIFIPALMLPGPDFVAVVRSSITRGTAAALQTSTGVTLGLGFYATLSLIGFSAILAEYQWLALIIRICGGLYLIYLGIRLLLSKPTTINVDKAAPHSGGSPLIFGLLVTLTNPKAIVLFTSVFATAVTHATPAWVMVAMISLVMMSSLIWYSMLSLFMTSNSMVARLHNTQHRIERAAGVCFIAIGGKIIADSRNPVIP